ncbi:MAG: 50S ribosomal protein L32e [Candidatus Methanosuratincola sp.]|jgi:large subunit ribosomal protein L32e|nr:50S ribosomal protein L32e [Candidatus Methanosuratincola sp.]
MTGCGCSQENCAHEFESLLRKRQKIASRRPKFRRSESNRFPRLGDKWRSSKGIRSKMRLKKKGKWPIVETGYRGPRLTRGLNPKGMIEVLVHTPEDVEFVDPCFMAIRIAASVGKRKRAEIIKRAEEFGVEIVNLRPDEKPKETKADVEGEEKPSEGTAASEASAEDQEGKKE